MIKNYQIFKETIHNIIQTSGLDIGVVYFILKDIFKEIETLYYTQINSELMKESEENINKEKEEKTKESIDKEEASE